MTIDSEIRAQLGDYRQSIDNIDAALIHIIREVIRHHEAIAADIGGANQNTA